MNPCRTLIASLAVALPLVAGAQTPTPPSDAKKTADVERKQTTETGQSTTYGQSGGMGKPDGAAEKDKNKITKGDQPTRTTPAKPLDDASTAKTPAKEGAQAGPQPK